MNNQKEIYEALLAGETLITCQSGKTFIMNEFGHIVCDNSKTWSVPTFEKFDDWQIYKEPKWYENIPEGGVLCWVSDANELPLKYPVLVDRYKAESSHPFTNDSTFRFQYAKPLTKQEIQVFMDNAPEDL